MVVRLLQRAEMSKWMTKHERNQPFLSSTNNRLQVYSVCQAVEVPELEKLVECC